MQNIWKWLYSPQMIASIIIVMIALVLCFIMRTVKNHYKRTHEFSSGQKRTFTSIIFSMLRFMILLLAVIFIMQVNGMNVSGIIAGLGIFSAIIGLALQDFIKDIIMGINIVSDHFFSIGECVEFEGREGVIVGLTLKTTKIGDLDDHSVTTVCNRNISQIRRLGDRFDIDIPLSYGEELTRINEAITDICSRINKIENVSKCTYEGTQSFESSSINYRVRIFCDAKYRADMRRAAHREIQLGLHDAGITIPFNQLDVHFDSADTLFTEENSHA